MPAPTTEYHFQTVDIVTKIEHKLSYKHPHPLFKSTSAVHNIWSCVKSTQFLTQEFQNSPHFFQSRTNFPNSKKKAFCYAFNVRSIISMSIMPTLNSLKPTFFAHMDSCVFMKRLQVVGYKGDRSKLQQVGIRK